MQMFMPYLDKQFLMLKFYGSLDTAMKPKVKQVTTFHTIMLLCYSVQT
jgi:hypothetical protein